MAKQVFISHCSEEDGQFAHRLANDLQRFGVRVWIAPESIRPGEDWVDAINRGLEESSHVLVVLTPAAVRSPWVKMEANTAIGLERQGRLQLIPLEVEPCKMPPLWASYHMISLRRGYEAGLNQIASLLGLGALPREPEQPFRQTFRQVAVPERPREQTLQHTALPEVAYSINGLTAPKVDRNLCNGCGDCVEVCPCEAISIVGGCARINPDDCIECGVCEPECPTGAIEME